MRLPVWIALRHLAAMRRRSFLGRVSLLAILGVGVGVGTLVTVLAFTGGFQDEVRDLLTGMNPSIFVSTDTPGGLDPQGELVAELLTREDVAALSPFVQQKGVLSKPADAGLKLAGCLLRGVDPETERSVTSILDSADPPLTTFLYMGDRPGILLGRRLAEELAVLPGEDVTFTTLLEDSEEPMHQVFFVQGFVESGLYEFDRRFAYVDLTAARDLFRAGGGADGLGVRVVDPLQVRRSSAQFREALSFPHWRVADWMDLNGEIFRWMGTMRAILFLSLSLIVLVAGFNVAGTMTLVVSEKSREIGVLRSLGAERGSILRLFVLEGWILGMAGVILGLILSWIMSLIFKDRPLGIPGEIYFIDHLPMKLDWAQIGGVSVVAVLVTLGAAFFPGIEALMRRPIEAITGQASAAGDRLRGWLRFFVTLQVYLLPLLGTLALLAGLYLIWTSPLQLGLAKLVALIAAVGVSMILLILGISVGISLNMLEADACARTRLHILLSGIWMIVLSGSLLMTTGLSSWLAPVLLFLLLYHGTWYFYFRRSQRVRAAFSFSPESDA
ncbi:ABC transporter permease [bacterium]|nr:ABC transporter permease [bacterium]